jgi:uncharacterized protein (DUF4415 family)
LADDMIRTAQKAPKRVAAHYGEDIVRLIEGATEKQKPGPKPSGKAKIMLTLRLDPDVVARFRATGGGWQTRMAEALKRAAV